MLICVAAACQNSPNDQVVLRLATTTSTHDSGLLDAILPDFEESHSARVDVISVGTGQALALGEAGDVDVVLVHARSREDEFVAAGHGVQRFDVMVNDFVIVGPPNDPAGVKGLPEAAAALAQIAAAEASFASRGDDSGTHIKEMTLWEAAGFPTRPAGDWYRSLGQGMGSTLIFANETGAYALTDRATFLAQSSSLNNLAILVGGERISENPDKMLTNPYGVIPVNPDKGSIEQKLAADFVSWLTSPQTQAAIANFGRDRFGQPLFYPAAAQP